MHARWLTLLLSAMLGLLPGVAWAHATPERSAVSERLTASDRPMLARRPAAVLPDTHADSPVAGAVVINEIAWGGTAASWADEWIELLNTSEVTVSLAGWRLRAADGDPNLPLSGEIGPRAYYLIERTDDTTVSDIEADLACPFGTGLSNDGESLSLTDATGQVVSTANADGEGWPNASEGASPTYRSLERVTPYTDDEDANWVSNDGVTTTGLDAFGNPLSGTPRARNAAYGLTYAQGADLSVAIVGPPSAIPGAPVTYTLAVYNRGGLPATEITLVDLLPPELTFTTQESPYPYLQAGDMVTWEIGALAPDQSATIDITAQATASLVPGVLVTNYITATTPVTEIALQNDVGSWTVTIIAPATDLAIDKYGPAQVTTLADSLDYTVTVTNTGTLAAANVVVTDVIPGQVQVLTASAPAPALIDGQLTWDLGQLAPGEVAVLTLTARLSVPITMVDQLTNEVVVTAGTADPKLSNNRAMVTTTVGAPDLAITCLMYDGYQLNDEDEALQILNRGTATAYLGDWHLCKDLGGEITCYGIPAFALAPDARAWLVKNAAAFTTSFGFNPEVELPSWPRMANTGDEALLQAPDGTYVDTLVYGDGNTAVPGWHGSGVVYYPGLRGEAGQLLCRKVAEQTGLPVADTDTVVDWIQDTADTIYGRQVRYPGWDVETFARPLSVTEPATMVVGIAPDNAYAVIADLLLGAQRSISIEVYSLTHPRIIEILEQQAREGVATTVFLEGDPVGLSTTSSDWQTQLYGCQRLESAGGQCWFMIHEPDDQIYNRYEFLHAKLAIIDDTWTVIGSQNLTQTGLPADDKTNGTTGSRGALIAIHSAEIARRARQVFALDLDPLHHRDVVRWNTAYTDRYGVPIEELVDLTPVDGISYTVRFPTPLVVSAPVSLELITAPEAALRQTDGLLALLGQAATGDRLFVEQLYEYVTWGADPLLDPNLRLQAYIAAARRGARVRVLLNGRNFAEGAPGPAEEQLATIRYLNGIAAQEHLDLQAALGNPTGEGIHNKMILVAFADGRRYAHVGSINGSESSSKVNREVAVQVASPEVYAYLAAMASTDWCLANPVHLPVVLRAYTPPPPPANHLVISEVAYTGIAEGEWIEVYNPTAVTVDIGLYKVGDAESPNAFEGMFGFPAGTRLAAGDAVVIAVNASQVPAADFEFYESTPTVPNMVPYPAWGSTEYPLALRDAGDQVVLLDGSDRPLDVIVWGDKAFPGVVPHPGVTVSGASLERFPPDRDTDDCAQDLRERYPPTPGVVPGLSR